MPDHPAKVPSMGIDLSLDSSSAYCEGVHDTNEPRKEAKFKVDFAPLSPKNRGCRCTPGTPSSAAPALYNIWHPKDSYGLPGGINKDI